MSVAVSGIAAQASASWLWPGVVSVLFAGGAFPRLDSIPGEPSQPDAETLRRIESYRKGGVYAGAVSPRSLGPVLATAAELLIQRERLPQCRFRFLVTDDLGDQHWRDMLCVWHWPGVLRVLEESTGQLVAQSAPGLPSVMGLPDESGAR